MFYRNMLIASNKILSKTNLVSGLDRLPESNHEVKSLRRRMKIVQRSLVRSIGYSYSTGNPGSGAGKGGGAGGSIKESGGSLGQYGAAQEEQFFFKKQREQLEKMKKKIKESQQGDLSQKEDK